MFLEVALSDAEVATDGVDADGPCIAHELRPGDDEGPFLLDDDGGVHMSGVLLGSQGELTLIYLQGAAFDQDAGGDGVLDFERVVAVISDCSDPWPFMSVFDGFAGVGKLESFEGNFVFLLGQVDDDGWVLLTHEDTVG